jgi:hypothetical protein
LDNVQLRRVGWQKRCAIKTPWGPKWLPVSSRKAPFDVNLCNVLLDKGTWRTKHLNLIRESYKKSAFFDEVFPHIEECYSHECQLLIDFNMYIIRRLFALFDISITEISSSSLDIHGRKDDLIISIMKEVHSRTYLSGTGAREFYNPVPYTEAEIEIIWDEFNHPVYPQMFGRFMPYMSSIDLLFNCGVEQSRKIIRNF